MSPPWNREAGVCSGGWERCPVFGSGCILDSNAYPWCLRLWFVGVMAGFNMSSDLQRPEQNIPVGTLSAICTSWGSLSCTWALGKTARAVYISSTVDKNGSPVQALNTNPNNFGVDVLCCLSVKPLNLIIPCCHELVAIFVSYLSNNRGLFFIPGLWESTGGSCIWSLSSCWEPSAPEKPCTMTSW